jgi:hypothetical protein
MFSFDPDREAKDLDLVAIDLFSFSEAALREGKSHPRINSSLPSYPVGSRP